MEHFLFHKLKKKQAQKLEKLKYRAIRGALGYRSSTPTNVMLAEAKNIPIFSRFRQLGRNYVSRCYTSSNNPTDNDLSKDRNIQWYHVTAIN
jgi:hypothetical protein